MGFYPDDPQATKNVDVTCSTMKAIMLLIRSIYPSRFSKNLENSLKNAGYAILMRTSTLLCGNITNMGIFPIHSKRNSTKGRLNTLPRQTAGYWHRLN